MLWAGPHGEERLTYGELAQRAERLARHLRGLGVGPDVPVVLELERSPELVIALLGVLTAGGAYLPLDPADPAERRALLREDSGAAVRLGPAELAALTAVPEPPAEPGTSIRHRGGCRRPRLRDLHLRLDRAAQGRRRHPPRVVRLVLGTDYVRLGPATAWPTYPVAFDAATLEIWGALLNGGRPGGDPAAVVPWPGRWPRSWRRGGSPRPFLTAGPLPRGGAQRRRRCCAGVSAAAGGRRRARRRRARCSRSAAGLRLINGYGPTESTTFAPAHRMRRGRRGAAAIPLGRPDRQHAAPTSLDPPLRPVPIGVLRASSASAARAWPAATWAGRT